MEKLLPAGELISNVQQGTELGSYPDCGDPIRQIDVLIEYETTDGQSAVWAECPNCNTVVHPA